MVNIFDTTHMILIPIVLSHCKSTKPKNHTSTLSITYFCTTEYLVRIKINCVRGWLIIFHLLIWLFYLLCCDITSLTGPEITLALLFITCFLWNGILFLPWEIVVWPRPDQLDQFLRLVIYVSFGKLYFIITLLWMDKRESRDMRIIKV